MGLDKYAGGLACGGQQPGQTGRKALQLKSTNSTQDTSHGWPLPSLSPAPRRCQETRAPLLEGQAPAGMKLGWGWLQRTLCQGAGSPHRHELSALSPAATQLSPCPAVVFRLEAGFLPSHVLWFGARPDRESEDGAAREQK